MKKITSEQLATMHEGFSSTSRLDTVGSHSLGPGKHFSLRCLVVLVVLVSLAGCGPNKRRDEAYGRWYHARAKMLYGVAVEHLKVGQLDKARNKARQALALDSKYTPAAVLLSKVNIEQGRYQRAIDQLQALRAVNPKKAEIVYLLGVAYEKKGQLADAISSYRQAHALDPSNLSCVTAAGEVMVSMGRVDEAWEYIGGFVRLADNEPGLLELAGRVATMRRRYDEAVVYYQRARDVDYKNPCYQESLGRAQFMARQYTKAVSTLNELTATDRYSKASWVRTMIGDCYMAMGQPRNARDAYYAARRLNGKDAGIRADIAKAALALNDITRAITTAREAVQQDSNCLEASMVLGYALLRDGQTGAAVKALNKAVSIHPRNPTLRCLLGKAYAEAGDQARARNCYTVALRLEGDNRLARALLDDKRGKK